MSPSLQHYDLVIRNGRVIDPETGFDAVAPVAIRGDRIVAVGADVRDLPAKRDIDAKGLVVAPGFIDLHAHGQSLPADRMQAFDGVTTALELEVGAWPIASWYDRHARQGRVLNYGTAAAWVFIRKHVMIGLQIDPEAEPLEVMGAGAEDPRWSVDVATPAQVADIAHLLDAALAEGGLGVGIPNGYAPGAGTKELIRICETAKAWNTPTFTHIAYASGLDPNSSVDSYMRIAGLAAATGCHMHICHLNSTSLKDIEASAALIQSAQAHGLPITTEAYPYGTGSTVLSAGFFMDPAFSARTGTDYSSISLVSTGHRFTTREELGEARLKQPQSLILWEFLDPENDPADQAKLDISVLYPGGAIASDGLPWSNTDGSVYTGDEWPLAADKTSHPRSSGTFTRFLNQYVRKRDALPLTEAIAKCALIPAQIMASCDRAFERKGRLQAGMDADIVIFDLDTLEDKATFRKMHLPAVGMKHVLVNGEAVITEGALVLDARPGRPLRRGATQ